MKLKKNTLIILIVILLAIAAVIWFTMFRGKSPLGGASKDSPFTGGLAAAAALGVPMKCEYSAEGATYTGIIKGKSYKGEAKMPDGTVGNVLVLDNCMYSWSNEEKEGIKSCFEEEENTFWQDTDSTDTTTQTSEASFDYEYKCFPTVVSGSEFDVPKDVNFMDLSSFGDFGNYGE